MAPSSARRAAGHAVDGAKTAFSLGKRGILPVYRRRPSQTTKRSEVVWRETKAHGDDVVVTEWAMVFISLMQSTWVGFGSIVAKGSIYGSGFQHGGVSITIGYGRRACEETIAYGYGRKPTKSPIVSQSGAWLRRKKIFLLP